MSEYAKNSDLFIKVSNGEYPYTLSKIKKENINFFFGPNIAYGLLAAMGFAKVNPTNKPDYEVPIEGKPTVIDGVYYQTWTGRDYTPEEKEAALSVKRNKIKSEINDQYNMCINAGYRDLDTVFHIGLTESDLSTLHNRRVLIELGYDGDFTLKSKNGEVFTFDKDKMLSIIKNCLLMVKKLDELVITIGSEIDAIDDLKKFPSSSDICTRFHDLINT